jgi:two-component system, cell cycle sensor histidine kinase and response regulator CckA
MAIPEKTPRLGLDDGNDVDETLAASAQARLRALDAMLGGVAHDLNNALSVVLMNLDVMQQDGVVMAKHGRRIDGMLDSMTGASALVRHLLNFSHSRRPEPEVVSLAEVLPSLSELLQVAIGREVDIVIEADDVGPCCVVVDQASFEVAVIHTALQLSAAMPAGGTITFDLARGEAPGDQIVLSIATEPRGLQPSDANHHPDLKLVEHFARDASGRMVSAANGANSHRVVIHLPASAETTTV